MSQILHGEDIVSREQYLALLAHQGGPLPLLESQDSVPARINHGRWIVDCECRGAQLVYFSDLRTWCPRCGNVASGGAWRQVAIPSNWRDIEQILNLRPELANRNWQPGETVEMLRNENSTHNLLVLR